MHVDKNPDFRETSTQLSDSCCGTAKLKSEKSNGSKILPRGSDEINKNETHNNEPTYEKKDIH